MRRLRNLRYFKINLNKISFSRSRTNNKTVLMLIILCFLTNNTSLSNFLILFFLLVLFFINLKSVINLSPVNLLTGISLVLTLLISTLNGFGFENLIRWLELMILFMIFPINFDFNKTDFYILFSVLIFIIFVQFGRLAGFNFVDTLLNNFYPIDKNYWETLEFSENAEFSTFNNRLAGLYYNPNLMGQATLLLYCFIIPYAFRFKTALYVNIISFISFLSILATGSRTASVIFLIIGFSIYFRLIKSKLLKLFIFTFLIIVISFIIQSFDLRAFYNLTQIFSNPDDSGGQKLKIFLNFFKNYNYSNPLDILNLFFGRMGWYVQFDQDIGYLISFFGFFGFIFILTFFYHYYKKTEDRYKIFYCIFLICLGSTVIINFKFSIVLFIILSSNISYNRPKQEIVKKNKIKKLHEL